MMRHAATLALLVLPFATLGCSKGGEPTQEISGTVTFDGQNVPDGDIVFLPADGKGGDAGKIKDGAFKFRAKPGKHKVKITATRPGKVDPAMGQPTPEDYIPAKYNSATTLEEEVGPGKNAFEFKLTSK